MAAAISNIRVFALGLALAGAALFTSAPTRAADIYDAAVQHRGRTDDDQKRDALDHPAEILRLAASLAEPHELEREDGLREKLESSQQ